jgi:hypothetical protein
MTDTGAAFRLPFSVYDIVVVGRRQGFPTCEAFQLWRLQVTIAT